MNGEPSPKLLALEMRLKDHTVYDIGDEHLFDELFNLNNAEQNYLWPLLVEKLKRWTEIYGDD